MIIVPGAQTSLGVTPPSTGWSTLNVVTATIADTPGGRLFTMPDINADWTAAVEYRALASTSNYTLTAYLDTALKVGNRSLAGLVLRQSSNSRLLIFGFEAFGSPTGDAGNRIVARGLTSESTGNATPSSTYARTTTGAVVTNNVATFTSPWLRISDDGTTRYLRQSSDGVAWSTVISHSRTTWVTADQIGWFRMNNCDRGSDTATLRYWGFS